MKVAVIGSRNLTVDDLGKYLPPETTEIIMRLCDRFICGASMRRLGRSPCSILLRRSTKEYEKYGWGRLPSAALR